MAERQRVVSVDLDLKELEAKQLVESDVVTAISNGSLNLSEWHGQDRREEVPMISTSIRHGSIC